MDGEFKEEFQRKWRRYFDGARLPLCLFYSDDEAYAEHVPGKRQGPPCVIGHLEKARRGGTLALDEGSTRCPGGRRYLGFTRELMPNFEYFLSSGIPGRMEGERYKKSPELVRRLMADSEPFDAPGSYAVFKRWDRLTDADEPEVVIFLDEADVLSGLFTLANFDEEGEFGVMAPFGAGCATIAQRPCLEARKARPRAVLGMFDVSARPCVAGTVLSFAVPTAKFRRMVGNMDESFLITDAWDAVRRRIAGD